MSEMTSKMLKGIAFALLLIAGGGSALKPLLKALAEEMGGTPAEDDAPLKFADAP